MLKQKKILYFVLLSCLFFVFLKAIEPYEVDLDVNHDGYLFLATKKTAKTMIANHKVQL
jgi:hypothetical protein